MAPAARRRRRLVPVFAQVAAAVVAAVAVPTLALAGTATAVTAQPITVAASPDYTETSPTADPAPTGPTPDPTATGPSVGPTPSGSPTAQPPASPPPTQPPVGSPQPTQSSDDPSRPFPPRSGTRRPSQGAPTKPGQPRLGVLVSTRDVALTSTYWHQAATVVDLWITVENTGQITERVGLRYTLPSGVTDVGTPGCGSAGPDSYACAAWTAHAGARWSTRLRLRIAGDAWKAMPLRGSVQVTATAPGHPGAGEVADDHGFAVLFPAGSPPGGITVTGTAGGLAAVGRSAGGTTDVRHLALTLIGVSTLLILLALTLAVTSLRRRLSEDPLPPAAPAAAPVD